MRDHGAHHVKRSAQISVEDRIPCLVGGILQTLARNINTDQMNQCIDLPQLGQRLSNNGIRLLSGTEVGTLDQFRIARGPVGPIQSNSGNAITRLAKHGRHNGAKPTAGAGN